MTDKPSKTAPRSGFVILLAMLALVLIATPIRRLIAPESSPGASNVVVTAVFVAMLLAAAHAVSMSRHLLIVVSVLSAPVVVLHALTLVNDSDGVLIASLLTEILFFVFIIVIGLRSLFTASAVTVDTIAASLCIYVLMALLWASVFSLTELLQPGSFVFTHGDELQPGRLGLPGSDVALYYSLVTQSTLGYGDVAPTTSSARMFAAIEAISGQLYLAVLVARLVALHIMHSSASSGSAASDHKPR